MSPATLTHRRPMISITIAPSSHPTPSPPPTLTRLSKTSTLTTPDPRTDLDQLSGSIRAGDIQRESTKAGPSRPMGFSLAGRLGPNQVMVGSRSMDNPVRNTGLGINAGRNPMSLAPNMDLGMVGSRSTRRPNRSMDLDTVESPSTRHRDPNMDLGTVESPSIRHRNPSMDLGTGENPSTRHPSPNMDLGTGESPSLKHRQLNSDLGMVGSRATVRNLVMAMSRRESRAMVRKVVMEKSHREGQAMGGPVMRRQKARRGRAMGGLSLRGRVTAKSHRGGPAMEMSRHPRGQAMGGPATRARKVGSMRSPVMGGARSRSTATLVVMRGAATMILIPSVLSTVKRAMVARNMEMTTQMTMRRKSSAATSTTIARAMTMSDHSTRRPINGDACRT